MILIDAGPLVALFHGDDRAHEDCRDLLGRLREPLLTVWPVVAEAMYLLNFSWEAQEGLLRMIEAEDIKLAALEASDAPRIRELMQKYRDLPMDLADAALVCIAEKHRIAKVFTLDRRDFGVYRTRGTSAFTIMP